MQSDLYHAFMLDHTIGALNDDMALAAELHMLLSKTGANTAALWQTAYTALIESSDNLPQKKTHARVLPEALELACGDFETVPWKRGLTGVHSARRGKGKGKLMRLDPGQSAPTHNHSALEATVVLHGSFEDGHGVYERGDLVLAEPGTQHRPSAHGDEMCICFVAQEARPFWRLS